MLTMFEARYQPRRLNIVSGIGAHRNLNVCGSVLMATSPAIAASPKPCCFAMYPIVTDTNPLVAPNGRKRIIQTIG